MCKSFNFKLVNSLLIKSKGCTRVNRVELLKVLGNLLELY